jgi:hypothetical protein
VLKQETIDALPGFRKRMDWFLVNRPDLLKYITVRRRNGDPKSALCLLAIPSEERLRKCLAYMLDENEFLSDFGIRSLSKAHEEKPFVFDHHGQRNEVATPPARPPPTCSAATPTGAGPSGFPPTSSSSRRSNAMHYFYGDTFKVEYPTGSGNLATLHEIAIDLCDRLISLMLPDVRTATAPVSATPAATPTPPTGRTSCSFTNTSTPKPAKASVPPTKPAGPPSSSASSASEARNPVLQARQYMECGGM